MSGSDDSRSRHSGRMVPFFKGRVALFAILEALGIGRSDQVLLPGYTCIVVPNAILYRGADPVYVDIDPQSFNLDIDALESTCGQSWHPERARALIVQHTYGRPADMEPILAFAARHELVVIEDACHALGSSWRGRPVGTIGDAAFFSSQWSKPITTGLGGWAQASSSEVDAMLRKIAATYPRPGIASSTRLYAQFLAHRILFRPQFFWLLQTTYRALARTGLMIGSSTQDELDCQLPTDYQRRMGRLQEQTLHRLLASVDDTIAARRRNAATIESELQRHGLPTMPANPDLDITWLRYPLRVGNKDELLALARADRMEIGDWFLSPVHPLIDTWERAAYRPGTCREAERASAETINLPTHARLGANDLERIVAFVAEHATPTSGCLGATTAVSPAPHHGE